MCVAVILNPGAELSPEEVYKMGNANADGFGIAWAEEGVVHWWKTLDYNVEYMTHLIKYLKNYQRFVHFRLATAGGVKVELCHPFEIGPLAACLEKGTANKVMMHNGHWSRASEIFDIMKEEQGLPDRGPWSDTRLAAYLASWDEEWLSTVTGKVATLDGNGTVKMFGFWDKLREDVLVSNKIWDHNHNYKRTGSGRYWQGWGWTDDNWKAKEAHDREVAEKAKKEAEEKEKEEKEKSSEQKGKKEGKEGKKEAGNGGKNEGKSGEEANGNARGVGVGVGRGNGQLSLSGEQRGTSENHKKDASGAGSTLYEDKEGEFSRKFDFTPWRNPATGEWFQVDPTSVQGRQYRVRSLTEAQAREIMESLVAAAGEALGKP